VLISDADLSTPIEELEKLEPYLASGQCDLVLGSRATEDAAVEKHQPFYREFMGRTFNTIVRRLGVRDIRDTQCGFKLLRGDPGGRLFESLLTPGFAFDVELVWLAQRAGLGIEEVGVIWINSPVSKVRIWIDPVKMLLEVLVFRWRHGRSRES
jgi:dolichyl-phosphate beta-glucosyltransferase